MIADVFTTGRSPLNSHFSGSYRASIERHIVRRKPLLIAAALTAAAVLVCSGCKSVSTESSLLATTTASIEETDPIIAAIREEGLERSQVMDHADYLCNVFGPRLTGSPGLKSAQEWAVNRLASYGLQNVHLEEWGPFGTGWTVERYTLQVVEPRTILTASYPKAWSPGVEGPVQAEVIYVKAKKQDELKAYEGKLKGKIVFFGDPKKLETPFTSMATRMDDARLEEIANQPATASSNARQSIPAPASQPADGNLMVRGGPTSSPATGPTTAASAPVSMAMRRFSAQVMRLARDEGAIAVVEPSMTRDGSGYTVAGVTVPAPTTSPANDDAAESAAAPATQPRAWQLPPEQIPPQISMSSDHYARILRLLETTGTVTMSLDLRVGYHPESVKAYNVIAEIPGTDLADEVVMVGGHIDSWHAATGATDNAAGASAAMEAVRILSALNLKPRRTIRVALWSGEEIGLLGSTAYVKQHFGYEEDAPASTQPATMQATTTQATTTSAAPKKQVVKLPGYEKLSVYFNLDNGTGRIRGVNAQGNDAAVPLFRDWLRPFHDLDAKTVSLRNSGSTDHISFNRIGLPGFQFIQDPIDYGSRTWHTTLDTYERLQADDLKQASTIMAAFLWRAANMDERFPRKPANE